jgi:hypothetical protein
MTRLLCFVLAVLALAIQVRDRDRIYGSVVTRRLRAMGIRDKPTAPASPWQNGSAERLIGSIRRECVDHIIVLREMHLRRVNASILEQGCAGFSPGLANRCDQFTRHAGRTSSPLRPSLSFRYTQASQAQAEANVSNFDDNLENGNLKVPATRERLSFGAAVISSSCLEANSSRSTDCNRELDRSESHSNGRRWQMSLSRKTARRFCMRTRKRSGHRV